MRFTQDHQWIALEGGVATIGVTAYAAEALGDVIVVTLPAVGQALRAGGPMASIVSANRGASDLPAPVDGEVAEVNIALPDTPDRVNEDPEKDGWIVRVRIADPRAVEALMDRPAYEAFLDTL